MRVVASRQTPENKTVATEVDLFVDPKFATGFFDSCKGVKFGSANEFAMTFIGGGAKTPRAM